MSKLYVSSCKPNGKAISTSIPAEVKLKPDTVYIYPGDTYLNDEYLDYKVLFFTKYIEHFIVVISSEDSTRILQLVERLEKCTGYTWDRVSVTGREHNKAIDDFASEINDEP